jgi:hypothetical protein
MKSSATTLLSLHLQVVAMNLLLLGLVYLVATIGFPTDAQLSVKRTIQIAIWYIPIVAIFSSVMSVLMAAKLGDRYQGLVPISWGYLDWVVAIGCAAWAVVDFALNPGAVLSLGVALMIGRIGISLGEAAYQWYGTMKTPLS